MELSSWRQAWRSLRRRPVHLVAAVCTLAFGTGVTTAVSSLVHTVLVRDLPYPSPDRLVTVYESSPSAQDRTSLIAPGRLDDWQRLSRSFDVISGSYSENVTDTSGPEPERLAALRVAPRFFAVYGTEPVAGRTFVEEEERFGGPGAAVISDAFWTRRFGRALSAVGHALVIGGVPFTIVGVMPSSFAPVATDVWLPAQTPPGLMKVRDARFLAGIGRMKPGLTVSAAMAELAAVQETLERQASTGESGWSVEGRAMKDARIGDAGRGLLLLLGAVLLLWFIAVANVAGLTLVEINRRARELALRTALGASRARVVASVVREAVIVAAIGGALGIALASWLVSIMPAVLRRTPRIDELTLDWRAVAFVAGTSLLAACVFGVLPAMAGTRARLAPLLVSGGSRQAGAARHGLQRGLVIGQVALSVLLVATATLLVQSYRSLTFVDAGFDASDTMVFRVGARWDEDRTRVAQLQRELLTALRDLPHVQAAGMTNFLPATGATLRFQVNLEGVRGPNEDGSITVGARTIGGDYLPAIRAMLVAGDWCPAIVEPSATLIAGSAAPLPALVNRRFVDVHAPGQNIVGRTLTAPSFGDGVRFAISGVVGDIVEDGHAAAATPYIYMCNPLGSWPDPEYVVRTRDSRALGADVRRIINGIDPARAVFSLRPLQEVVDASLQRPRLDAALLLCFAGAALLLAAVGQYSLFMLVVSERSREMAVRLAIGAEPRQVMRLVLTGAGRLLMAGIVLGLILTVAASRVMQGLLHGVSPTDPMAIVTAIATLVLVCTIATAVPARRASRVSPATLLKGD